MFVFYGGRQHTMFRVSRRHLPLTLAFAITSRAAQGQTCSKGAIVDLCIRGTNNAMSSYVAITREEVRSHLLIPLQFRRKLFDQRQKTALELLLKVWCRAHIDWPSIESSLHNNRCVTDVEFTGTKNVFGKRNWTNLTNVANATLASNFVEKRHTLRL